MKYTTYLDMSTFPLAVALRENFEVIQRQCDTLFSMMDVGQKPNALSMGQFGKNVEQVGKPMLEGDVRSVYLFLRPELLDDNEKEIVYAPGREKERGWRRLQNPRLVKLLIPFIDKLGNVGFNRIYPGAKINPHFGVSTDYFRLHLCIHGDPRATFYLKDQDSYTWRDGETMAFADGDVMHWVEHNGTGPRTILSIDILKSELEAHLGL